MFKTSLLPRTAGMYRVFSPPKEEPVVVPVAPKPDKCARKGCSNPRCKNRIYCTNCLGSTPNHSFDDVPAIND